VHWTEQKRCPSCDLLHCYWCGVVVWRGPVIRAGQPNPIAATREHVIPRSRGGGGDANVVIACYGCNAERGNAEGWVPFHERGQRPMPPSQRWAWVRLGYPDV